ncbi:sensor histidine kinase [Microbacterium thalassium]|uniref:histidine kinase n=1 Tax=Microbacterium thalassium TaxID=362649 RepID=A0A7X0FRU6_9MICO|nr:HAMP domain-containing sensor histidine kinase [Microbacterium thalassium]MBB6392555.1 two-component system OmpR family sensor kinase [Microbacterium thalassium]GLK23214.1 two-component sensor histidine kinase [Microbacterium thalassium]
MAVAVLAMGLLGAGILTTTFLRGALASTVEDTVRDLARTDVASQQFDIFVERGELVVEPSDTARDTDLFVAVYGPTPGELLAVAGGRGATPPDLPETFPPDRAYQRDGVYTVWSEDGEAEYRYAVTVQEVQNAGTLYTQLVAAPLAGVNRTIATYLGIYSIIAVITIALGAILIRLLVTLAFRSLGQVEATAMSIAEGDFSTRMTEIEPGTEVGRLKRAINAMLDRVDGAITQRDSTVQQMRRFVGDASHELRTPLVTVRGYAELYRMGAIQGDEQVAQSMDRIEKEAIRMGAMVEDLLALARLDERRDVVITDVDLRPIARDAALDVRATSPLREVTVIDTTSETISAPAPPLKPAEPEAKKRRSGPSLAMLRRRARQTEPPAPEPPAPASSAPPPSHREPVVLGDENRIRQVVTNLLGNARRFTADDSPIELRVGVDQTQGSGWIEVSDHGPGVPDQIKEKIFQRFWRADTSRTRETGGSGLGLSIVASIMDALHGSVTVMDTPGGGATFRVAFPLARARDAEEHRDLETQPLQPPPG